MFQTAYLGVKSARFGSLTFGRQQTLLAEGTIKYDPNYNSTAFGLLGASNTYSGGGSSENNRLDSTAKYALTLGEQLHLAALYKFNGSNGSANTAVQANIGGSFAGASLDAYYSKVNSSITAGLAERRSGRHSCRPDTRSVILWRRPYRTTRHMPSWPCTSSSCSRYLPAMNTSSMRTHTPR